jgi:hypothetical protein
MKSLLTLVVIGMVCVAPARAEAWGYDGHKFIMDRAIALLPPEIRPMFERYRQIVVERSIDPDLWRDAGFEEEFPNHQIDLDWEGYGKYPYLELPRDYTAAVAKFGRSRIRENGTVPWRTEEMHGQLRRAFEAYGRQGAFGRFAILHTAAWLSHYVGDAHQPLHTVINYDGQSTNQRGIHVRFESLLFERYRSQWTIAPTPIPPVRDPREFIFRIALDGAELTQGILKADAAAIGNRDVYDDAYYAAFFKGSRPILERRLNESIAAVAAMIAGAWEAAGKPALPLDPVEAPQRRRRN